MKEKSADKRVKAGPPHRVDRADTSRQEALRRNGFRSGDPSGIKAASND
jgi:hypothetical protein